MRRGTPVRGMSLVELLVAIAIIGALCCLLMSAVQSAREAARQAHCKNNLKQIGLALQSYEGTWNAFPPSPLIWTIGPRRDRYAGAILSMHALILPGVDQAATFNAINFQVAPTNVPSLADPGINATAARTAISTFLCPSDAAPLLEPYGPTNYRANLGDCGECGGRPWHIYNGAFNRRETRPADFTDGLSTTISLSEKPIGGAPAGLYMPMRDWIFSSPGGRLWFVMSADAWRQYCAALSYSYSLPFVRYDGGRSWMLGETEYTGLTTAVTPNSEIPDCGTESGAGVGVFAARSYHPGTVHVAMADGSVRSVSNRVDLQVWRALGTRGGGELVSAGSY